MSNIEHFNGVELNRSAPEYKEFKAELYNRPAEFAVNVPEMKINSFESFDDQNSVPVKDNNKSKASDKSDKKSTRKRVQSIFESISKTVAKVSTTVVGVAAVGVGAVVALSPLFSPSAPPTGGASLNDITVGGNYLGYELNVFELEDNVDYDIVVASDNHRIVKDEVDEGINKDFIIGLNTDTEYTISLVSKRDNQSTVHYESSFTTNKTSIIHDSYQASLEIPLFDDITVEWKNDENIINIPTVFTPHTDENYRYRVSLIDKNNHIIDSYEGIDSGISLSAPLNIDDVHIFYEELYDAGENDHLYKNEKSEKIILKAPQLYLSDNKQLLDPGIYKIEYGLFTELEEMETYSNIKIYINGEEHDLTLEPNIQNVFYAEFYTPTQAFDVEAIVTFNGAYGGNPRTITARKQYVNQLEFYDKAYYSAIYNTVEFKFIHSEINGYVLIKDKLNSTEEQITSSSHYYSFTGDCEYTYALYDQNGTMLTEEKSISFKNQTLPSEYSFNSLNPTDVVATTNDDNTINLYFDTGFNCDNPNVFYRIIISGLNEYVFESRDRLAKFEGIPLDQYGLKFDIVYLGESNEEYHIANLTPSGTIDTDNSPSVNYSLIDNKTLQVSFSMAIDVYGEFIVKINGRDYVCNASELVTDEYNHKRYLTLSVDEDISTIEITSYIKYITAYDYILTDFKDEIKGTPYFKTITN